MFLADDGIIPKSVSYINKAFAKVIERVYAEYEVKRLEKATEFLCDQFLSKFSAILGGLDAIETPEDMEKELKDLLLRSDLKKVLSYVTPLVPFLGLLPGGVTVGQHVWKKQSTEEPRSMAKKAGLKGFYKLRKANLASFLEAELNYKGNGLFVQRGGDTVY